jgi:lysophospholipase L1-like esterase
MVAQRIKIIHLITIVTLVIILTGIELEVFFRYYYFRWNENLSVPFLLFARAIPYSKGITEFIQPSQKNGIIFELKPNIRSTFLGVLFSTNGIGAIGSKEYSKSKPYNTVRIIGIGDSIMSSWGVAPEHTFLQLIESRLRETYSKQYEVINLSVPGYNTAIEFNVLKVKAMQYDPDLIIMQYCGNDYNLPSYIRKKVYSKSYAYFVIKTALQRLFLANKPQTHMNYFNAFSDAPRAKNNPVSFASEIGEVPKEYEYMVGIDNYIRTMQAISDYAKQRNIPILLLLQDSSILSLAPQITRMGFYILDADKKLTEYLNANSFEETDVSISSDDPHLNLLGHKLYADFILEYITSETSLTAVLKPK